MNKISGFIFSSAILVSAVFPPAGIAAEVSITVDDPTVVETPLLNPQGRNQRILTALQENGALKAALFVCGKRIDNAEGKSLVESWNSRGHLIASHSYSHLNYNSASVTFDQYQQDFFAVERLLAFLPRFKRFYRFPFLKEGDTVDKRDKMRALLHKEKYRNGHVTIDASDWYIDQRMRKRLSSDPKADTKPFRDYYLKHIWDRATFYDDLAKKVVGRQVKQTLLIHHNLLNALYLGDLLKMFRQKGWKLISAHDAFSDPVFLKEPSVVPAGESLIWALAKETGKFESILRYPGEDDVYQKAEMDQLGL